MLENTGERLVTELRNRTMIEHLHRYALALQYVQGKIVLDAACGEGYGSNLLISKAREVIGLDISIDSIDHAKSKYKNQNLKFIVGDVTAMPIPNDSIDIIVSFETIEHHDKHHEMMCEFKRVLKENGVVIISTPDKKFYSDTTGYYNPFHVKELYLQEFRNLLLEYFKYCLLLKQGVIKGSVIYSDEISADRSPFFFRGNFEQIENLSGIQSPEYLVSIASDLEPPVCGTSFFESNLIDENFQEMYNDLAGSRAYRLGNVILTPLRLIRNFISRWLA